VASFLAATKTGFFFPFFFSSYFASLFRVAPADKMLLLEVTLALPEPSKVALLFLSNVCYMCSLVVFVAYLVSPSPSTMMFVIGLQESCLDAIISPSDVSKF
jgi:hypothetical protein